MECLDGAEIKRSDKTCYLLHNAIRKENSTMTKLRVVFDASCKTDWGFSLNDVLLKSPFIQNELLCILARFRYFQVRIHRR